MSTRARSRSTLGSHFRSLTRPTLLVLPALLSFAACGPSGSDAPGAKAPAPAAPIGGTEAEAALDAALEEPGAYARARALGALLPRLDATALPYVRDALERRINLGPVEFDLLARFWAEQEPHVAAEWVLERASPLYRNPATSTIFELWAENDPRSAVMLAEGALAVSNEITAKVAQSALVRGWFKNDRKTLEVYIRSKGAGIARQTLLHSYAVAFVINEGSDAAIEWAVETPTDDRGWVMDVHRQLMSALAWADMEAARRFCDMACDGPYGRDLRSVLVRTWLRRGEEGGPIVEWVAAAKEENEVQQQAKRHVLWVTFATWAHRDKPDALAWMKGKLEETPLEEHPAWLRRLYGEYARQLATDAPVEAMEWALRVEDANERELTQVRVARTWREQDEAAAEAWLEASSLSERALRQARSQPVVQRPMRPRRRRAAPPAAPATTPAEDEAATSPAEPSPS